MSEPSEVEGIEDAKQQEAELGEIQETLEKPRHEKEIRPASSFRELFRFASRKEIFLTITGVFLATISGCFAPAFALVLGAMIDSFVVNDDSKTGNAISDANGGLKVQDLSIVFVALGGFALFATFVNRAMLQASAEWQLPKLKQAYLNAVLRQDIAWIDANPVGKVQSILTELDSVTDAMGERLSEAIGAAVQFLGGVVVAIIISWKLTMVMFAAVPLIAIALGMLMLLITRLEKNKQKWSAESMIIFQEATSSVRTVHSLGAQVNFLERYKGEASKLKENFIALHRNLATNIGSFVFIMSLTYSLTLWYGSKLVKDGHITPGELITVFFAIQIGSTGLPPLGIALSAITQGRQSLNPALAVIDRIPPIDSFSCDGTIPSEPCQGAIELRDIHFHYPTRPDVPIFQGYNLSIAPGKTVALVGESGGGKSTVISLLERFYDPVQGQVLLDGVDVRTLNVQWLREQIGLVSQEPTLFASSIMENIRHGKREATDDEVIEAAKMANADDFISGFPDGYNTEVGERGVQLSGGQKQRVAIARAIIKDPKILLLDEATSALDSESEEIVQAALDDLMKAKQRTTIVVAHRLSTIQDADSIAVVYDGKIVEQGTHDELIKINDGKYQRLASRQQARTGRSM